MCRANVGSDVKLDNMLLDIKKRHIYLADFGFALKYTPGRRSKEWLGSLSYSAPEILLRRPYEGELRYLETERGGYLK